MKNYKTLVVDDHMMMRKMVENNLNDLGINSCDMAVNGREALQKINQCVYDIVLADWHMPELSGEDLLAQIRGQERFEKTAFVMVTAESEQNNILKVMHMGATAYITKPFSDEEFRSTMENVVKWLEERK